MTRRAVATVEALQAGAVARFAVQRPGLPLGALAVWTSAGPRAYLDVCAHRGQPLDEVTPEGLLHCGAHGASYDPATGVCVSGPCPGARLTALACGAEGGSVWVDDEEPYDDRGW